MTQRKTVILVLTALLLTVFSVALSRRDSRDWRATRSRRLLPFPWQDAVKATIRSPGGDPVELFLDTDGEWNISLGNGVSDNLGPGIVESLAALGTLAWREPVADRLPPEPGTETQLEIVSAAGQRVKIALGETRQNLRTAVIDDDPTVLYGVKQELVGFLEWLSDRYRSMLLTAAGTSMKLNKILLAPYPQTPELNILMEARPSHGWELLRPISWRVDENRLDIVIRWLERLRADGIAAETGDDPEAFGFSDASPSVEVWYAPLSGLQGQQLHKRVEFGGDAGNGRIYARETGRSPVFLLPKKAMAEISFDVATGNPNAWRNFYRQRSLDRLGSEIPERVVIERLLPPAATLTVTVSTVEGVRRWRGVLKDQHGSRSFEVDPPDGRSQTPLAALFTGLGNLRVKNFLADTAPGPDTVEYTAFPAWRFSLRTADGRDLPGLTLYAADAQGTLAPGMPFIEGLPELQELSRTRPSGQHSDAGLVFSISDRPAVLETFGESASLLCLPPYRYQSRRMMDSDPRLWSRVEILHAETDGTPGSSLAYTRKTGDINEQWWREASPPEPLMNDNNRFVSALVKLSQLRSDGFVQDVSGDIEKFGLDQPEITAIVYSSSEATGPNKLDGPLFMLSLGRKADAEGRRYARLDDAGPVFLVPPSIATALGLEYR